MRVVLKLRRHASLTACPPDSFWEQATLAGLSRAERRQIHQHCLRCEICRLRQQPSATHDWIPAWIVSGLVATVLLSGTVRLHKSHRAEIFEGIAYSPLTYVASPFLDPEDLGSAAAEEETIVDEEAAPVRTVRETAPVFNAADLRPVGPQRPFTPPKRTVRTPDPVRLPTPPTLRVRFETPTILAGAPALQPPRRHPFRKFISVLAVPFRRS